MLFETFGSAAPIGADGAKPGPFSAPNAQG
jgi:hypothetical protein